MEGISWKDRLPGEFSTFDFASLNPSRVLELDLPFRTYAVLKLYNANIDCNCDGTFRKIVPFMKK